MHRIHELAQSEAMVKFLAQPADWTSVRVLWRRFTSEPSEWSDIDLNVFGKALSLLGVPTKRCASGVLYRPDGQRREVPAPELRPCSGGVVVRVTCMDCGARMTTLSDGRVKHP